MSAPANRLGHRTVVGATLSWEHSPRLNSEQFRADPQREPYGMEIKPERMHPGATLKW